LINLESLEKFDSQGMHKVYDIWPEISRKHFEADLEDMDFGEISHVVFAGMGGSGAISDIFSAILSKKNIHVEVIKGYLLPKTVDSNSLVVTTSISGNTEETLNVLKAASDLKCNVVAFSDGGKMQKFCEINRLNHRNIPMIHSPRASFPSFLFSMLRVLEPFLPIKKIDILDSITKLEEQKEKISSLNLTKNNPAISLANSISEIPLIYYPWGLQAASIRFKNSLQENAKMHAISEDIIEACHNGVVSWDKPSVVKPLLIQGEDDFIKTKERWKILKEFFKEKKIDYDEIYSVKGSILSKLINLIYVLDYTSIYKAVLSETNPSPVVPIDFIKSKLHS
jgi:glucose/mannose-6-phosphate isomerase